MWIAAGAVPIGSISAEQLRRIQVDGLAMIGIEMIDGALLGFQQGFSSGNNGQKLFWLQIQDAAKTRNQMGLFRNDAKERKILEIDEGLRGWMGVQIASAQQFPLGGNGFLGTAAQHDPSALQRIALDPLVKHQGDPAIGKDVSGMNRQP